MAYWLTFHYPRVSDGEPNNGIWVRPGKELAAQNLSIGDLVFIYETSKNKEEAIYGGAEAVTHLVKVKKLLHRKYEKWVQVAETDLIEKGKCPHRDLLKILDYQRFQSFGPMNSKLKEITRDEFDQIADYFPKYKSENQIAEEKAADALGDTDGHSGQGFATKEDRELIDKYSMEIASDYFSKYFTVENHSDYKPYDLYYKNEGEEYFVEVKGTRGFGEEIILTNNEVHWAKSHSKNMILFIVHSIKLQETPTGKKASGGELFQINKWKPSDGLTPIAFRYTVPSKENDIGK